MACKIRQVPGVELAVVLPRVTELLDKVVTNETGFDMNSVLYGVVWGEAVLWEIDDLKAVIITEVVDRPTERVLWVKWLAGEGMVEWLPEWVARQEDYARETGCKAIEFNGRPGFKRAFEKQFPDYKVKQIVIHKRFD